MPLADVENENEGEMGELKKKYGSQLTTLRDFFPDWKDDDFLFALQETDGDLDSTVERITEGSVSQWGEVKKKSKERSRSKAQEPASTVTVDQSTAPSGPPEPALRAVVRREAVASIVAEEGPDVADEVRPGLLKMPYVPTEESPAWDPMPATITSSTADDSWDSFQAPDATNDTTSFAHSQVAVPETKKSSVIPDGTKKSWASMFKPTPPPAPKHKPPPVVAVPLPPPPSAERREPEPEALPPPSPVVDVADPAMDESLGPDIPTEPEPTLTPPKDQLTETNLEQVPDTSVPVMSATQASTVATSTFTPAPTGPSTPYSGSGHGPLGTSRPLAGGYASSAYRATGTPGRTSSFQRRVLNQLEPVVLPGEAAVDRASVQFGSLGLNGSGEEGDVDDEREEAETRAQPPQHSPVAHPVASLPRPTSHQTLPPGPLSAKESEPISTPRPIPGLPAAALPQLPSTQPQGLASQPSIGPPGTSQPPASQSGPSYGSYGRYGPSAMASDPAAVPPKSYDAFGPQPDAAQAAPSPYEGYSAHHPNQAPQPAPASHLGGLSSAPTDYSSYYTSDPQQRADYQSYYHSMYGQHAARSAQDPSSGQLRSGGGPSQSAADPAHYGGGAPSRYSQVAENHASGHSTPNPGPVSGPAPPGVQPQASQPMAAPQQQASQGFPYGHPYYSSPYYAAYLNQFGYGQQYGAPFGGKGGPYGQPGQGYGMSPQSSYEHSSSPVTIGGAYGQAASLHGREAALGGALTEYGRSGSGAHGGPQHSVGNGGFGGGMGADAFGRGYPHPQHQQPLGQHAGNMASSGSGATEDGLKAGVGPSMGPSVGSGASNAGRPDATNSGGSGSSGNALAAQVPSGLPTSAASQASQVAAANGYGGYPNHHLNQHLQASGLGAGPGPYGVGSGGGGGPSASGYGGNGNGSSGSSHHHGVHPLGGAGAGGNAGVGVGTGAGIGVGAGAGVGVGLGAGHHSGHHPYGGSQHQQQQHHHQAQHHPGAAGAHPSLHAAHHHHHQGGGGYGAGAGAAYATPSGAGYGGGGAGYYAAAAAAAANALAGSNSAGRGGAGGGGAGGAAGGGGGGGWGGNYGH
ncbi:MAG: hypothetical protein M1826_002896 [Phylliscum demangeonii]|nr:MAG: hypothetical protein M1826_002896 [Phylliscum demangeonii]